MVKFIISEDKKTIKCPKCGSDYILHLYTENYDGYKTDTYICNLCNFGYTSDIRIDDSKVREICGMANKYTIDTRSSLVTFLKVEDEKIYFIKK